MGSRAISRSSPPLLHCLLPPPSSIPNLKPTANITKSLSLPGRRSLILLSAAGALTPFPVDASTALSSADSPADVSVAVTDRVFMDFSLCPSYFNSDRPIGFDLAACPEAEPIGRVVFGLYGKLVPQTVANFKALCNPSGYRGTLIHKIFQGQFFVAGRQGRREKGEVRPPVDLARNMDSVDPKAFQLKHSRPGILSLCLAQNDDDEEIKLNPDYRNVEFLVTTGPGPCPELDNENIVFGTVLEGKCMDIVTTIATIPTYKPAERIRQFNDFAVFLGDERAQIARTMWDRPLRTVYISDCGELQVAKPSLSPSLP
ncbi:hypothetical protein IEQ34_021234 [Dendrobium chrysotoxum]|uniref:PPIase cyclophilin-type domain-containing protein n=1 Tax=Dendrobium chrysotoxum TaxID=161865 RepID=A0AAV7G4Z7_DENCH|nr:hypothetical protein IEQ34_021234 [Dendrobium chrysotoxum]